MTFKWSYILDLTIWIASLSVIITAVQSIEQSRAGVDQLKRSDACAELLETTWLVTRLNLQNDSLQVTNLLHRIGVQEVSHFAARGNDSNMRDFYYGPLEPPLGTNTTYVSIEVWRDFHYSVPGVEYFFNCPEAPTNQIKAALGY